MKALKLRRRRGAGVEICADQRELEITDDLDSFEDLTEDLSAATRLSSLSINGPFGKVTDLGFLCSIPSLRKLSVRARPGDSITDSSAISTLTCLKELSFNDYAKLDLGHLRCAGLERISLFVPVTKSIDALFSFKKLTTIRLRQYRASDLAAFGLLTQLEDLEICGGRLGTVDGIGNLKFLHRLLLLRLGLKEVDGLSALRSLVELDLSSNKQIRNIGFVSDLSNLRSFRFLEIPKVHSFRPLERLKLTDLEISAVPDDGDLVPLQRLKNLERHYYHPKIEKALIQ